MRWFLLFTSGVVMLACQKETVIPQCDQEAKLVSQDESRWVCGGHYIFLTGEDFGDTVRVRYNAILRNFFVLEGIENEDFPVEVRINMEPLSTSDPCREFLTGLSCISLKK